MGWKLHKYSEIAQKIKNIFPKLWILSKENQNLILQIHNC